MVNIYIDGKNFEYDGDISNWTLVLKDVYEKLGREKRGIVKVLADNKNITEQISEGSTEKNPDEYQSINFFTKDIKDIAIIGVDNVKYFLPKLIEILKNSVEFAKSGKETQMKQSINNGLEGIKLIMMLFINLHILCKFNISDMLLSDGDNIKIKLNKLNEIFEIFNDVYHKKNNHEIAEIIENKIIPEVRCFKEIFEKIEKEFVPEKNRIN